MSSAVVDMALLVFSGVVIAFGKPSRDRRRPEEKR